MAAPTGRPLPALMSFEDFMEDSLHHPAWGYYTDGRVTFGESNAEDDFTTFPVTMRPVFGALLARRLEALRRACMAGEAEGAPFVVVELGAGLGALAHDIVRTAREEIPALHASMLYVIGERSAALRAAQTATNAQSVAEGAVAVVEADARELADGRLRRALIDLAAEWRARRGGSSAAAREEPKLRGVLLSNELLDAFAVEKLRVSRSAEAAALSLERAFVLPLIRRRELEAIAEGVRAAADGAGPIDTQEMVDRSAWLRASLLVHYASGWLRPPAKQWAPSADSALAEFLGPQAEGAGDGWVALGRAEYSALKAACCATGGACADGGTPLEIALDGAVTIAEFFDRVNEADEPALRAWLSGHADALDGALGRRCGSADAKSVESMIAYANLPIDGFAAGAARLFDVGAVITIDYGADAHSLLAGAAGGGSALRVRSRLPQTSRGAGASAMMFARPGWCDLTADVDFSQLATAGEGAGLDTWLYAPQTALESALDADAEAGAGAGAGAVGGGRTAYASSLSRGKCDAFYSLATFVMLVQTTRGLGPTGWARTGALPLTRGGGGADSGVPSMLILNTVTMLRTLGRLILEHAALLLSTRGAIPSERDLAAELADARLTTVPCFRSHWRPMARAVLGLFESRRADEPGVAHNAIHKLALAMVREDLEVLRAADLVRE